MIQTFGTDPTRTYGIYRDTNRRNRQFVIARLNGRGHVVTIMGYRDTAETAGDYAAELAS